jgi:hypothetical protein
MFAGNKLKQATQLPSMESTKGALINEFGMPESEMIGLKIARKADNYSTWILFCLGNFLFGSFF